MSRPSLPDGIATAFDGLRSASRSVLAGAREGRAESIQEAMRQRGEAVDALREALEAPEGRALDARIRRELLETISTDAQDIEAELLKLQERVRAELRGLKDGAKALRGYSGAGRDSAALDRQG